MEQKNGNPAEHNRLTELQRLTEASFAALRHDMDDTSSEDALQQRIGKVNPLLARFLMTLGNELELEGIGEKSAFMKGFRMSERMHERLGDEEKIISFRLFPSEETAAKSDTN